MVGAAERTLEVVGRSGTRYQVTTLQRGGNQGRDYRRQSETNDNGGDDFQGDDQDTPDRLPGLAPLVVLANAVIPTEYESPETNENGEGFSGMFQHAATADRRGCVRPRI